jgi:hypothetical protein
MNPSQLAEEMLSLSGKRATEEFSAGSVRPASAGDLLSPRQLGIFLDSPLVRYPQVRVAVAGKAIARSEYVTSRRIGTQWVDDGIDARLVARWLTRGATITLDSLEYLSEPVKTICARLAQALGLPATATAYVTPPGRQGLSPHTDEEDVFVLQTFGTKSWVIDSAQRQAVATASGFPFNEGMQLVTPRVLGMGDMFFMPAGTPHVASAQKDLSIHITFSVERPRIRNLIDQAIESVVSEVPALQRLQSWDRSIMPDVVEILRAFESEWSKLPHQQLAGRDDLPFESWDCLFGEAVSLRLKTDMVVTKTTEGHSLAFPTFTMKVGHAPGAFLERLTFNDWMVAQPLDDELKEILFHLVGRNVVEASISAPE